MVSVETGSDRLRNKQITRHHSVNKPSRFLFQKRSPSSVQLERKDTRVKCTSSFRKTLTSFSIDFSQGSARFHLWQEWKREFNGLHCSLITIPNQNFQWTETPGSLSLTALILSGWNSIWRLTWLTSMKRVQIRLSKTLFHQISNKESDSEAKLHSTVSHEHQTCCSKGFWVKAS